MKSILYIALLITCSSELFGQTKIVYNQNGVRYSWTENIQRRQFCSVGDVNYKQVIYDVKIDNYSGKTVSLDYSFYLDGTSVAKDCNFDENKEMALTNLAVSYSTGATISIKSDESYTAQAGGWVLEDYQPGWTIKIFKYGAVGQTKKSPAAKIATNHQRNMTYSLNQSSDYVNRTATIVKNVNAQSQRTKKKSDSIAYLALQRKELNEKIKTQEQTDDNIQRQEIYKQQLQVKKQKLTDQQTRLQRTTNDQLAQNQNTLNGINSSLTDVRNALQEESDKRYQKEIQAINNDIPQEHPQDVFQCEVLWTKGNDLYKKGDYINALNDYTEAFLYNKDAKFLYYFMGRCYYKLKTYKTATEYLIRHIKLTERALVSDFFPQSYYYLAQSKYKLVTKYKMQEYSDFCGDWVIFKKYSAEKGINLSDGEDLDTFCSGQDFQPNIYAIAPKIGNDVQSNRIGSSTNSPGSENMSPNLLNYRTEENVIKIYKDGKDLTSTFFVKTITPPDQKIPIPNTLILVVNFATKELWYAKYNKSGAFNLTKLERNHPRGYQMMFAPYPGDGVTVAQIRIDYNQQSINADTDFSDHKEFNRLYGDSKGYASEIITIDTNGIAKCFVCN